MAFSVRALFFAAYRERVGASELSVELGEGATVGDLVAKLRARGHPFDVLPREPAVAVNQSFGQLSDPLDAGDEVAFIPPVAGGQPGGHPMIHASITRSPIDPSDVLSQVGGDEDGAAILFLGRVRNHAEGGAVEGLGYESYEPMARDVLDKVAHEAAERWAIERVAVVHRVGELKVGEASVAIAVSSPHRAEAFAAARYVIEEIKVRVPIWKKERFVDGTEAWVDGSVPPVDATVGRDA